MNKTRRAFLAGAAAVAPTLMLPRRSWAATGKSLAVMHTNDTHSRMLPFDSGKYAGQGGVARRATLIQRIRDASAASVLLDAGDTFQGTPWFNAFQGEVDMKAMAMLGYDATCLGNHDFDAGIETLVRQLKHAPLMHPVVSNFAFDEVNPLKDLVTPQVVIDRAGVKVGLFGLGIAFEGLVNPKLHRGVDYADPREAARREIETLRAGRCDVVICVSHLGYQGSRGEVGDIDWPKDVPGCDYVVSGHTHTFLDEPTVIAHKGGHQTHVMQVGHSGLRLGHATLAIDAGGKVAVRTARARTVA